MAITQRDLSLLRWVGEQQVVPMAVLRLLVDRELPYAAKPASVDTLARRAARRLEQLGYAERRLMLGQAWLVPTRAGLRAAGLDYRAWESSEFILAHTEVVARLRLHLEARYPEAGWESERSIRSRWAGSRARVRITDGGLHWPDGRATGVEVELHVKKLDRYRNATTDLDPAWTAGVWWFTPLRHAELLRSRFEAVFAAPDHEVYPLPDGIGS